jgi:uncharacterized damage-inducible protein DinB
MQAHFQIFARYNAWANHRLYAAIAALPTAALSQDRPAAYFKTILGTLNHILVVDRLWLGRILREDTAGLHLDMILHDNLPKLRSARQEEDRRIIDLADRFGPRDFERTVVYRTTGGERFSTELGQLLSHLFNHQTHHRGQLHALLKDAGAEPPVLDLIYFMRAA